MKTFFKIALIAVMFFSVASTAMAQSGTANNPCTTGICLQNPLGSIDSPQALIGKIINSLLGVVGSIALLMFVYGGLTWMTSAGSSEKIDKGKSILVWSAIGLVVIFSAYGLTRFVLTTIAQ
jgi:hypothetical protein